jgi:hypothetical protein
MLEEVGRSLTIATPAESQLWRALIADDRSLEHYWRAAGALRMRVWQQPWPCYRQKESRSLDQSADRVVCPRVHPPLPR